jgi:hypothetical protein
MKRAKPVYPPGWKAFSLRIRQERAEGRCECTGECGLHRTHPGPRRCVEHDNTPAVWAHGMVVLTVAHLCHCDPPCVNPVHCRAFCQRCHLLTDLPMHTKHAAETRRKTKEMLGQCPMPFME